MTRTIVSATELAIHVSGLFPCGLYLKNEIPEIRNPVGVGQKIQIYVTMYSYSIATEAVADS